MADPRTSFVTLEDAASAVGLPLHKALEGDAYAGKNAHGAFVAKSGPNFVYLKTNTSTGALLVDNGADTTCLKAKGEFAAGSLTLVEVTNAEIVLTVSTVYQEVGFLVSCRRDALFQVIWLDDVTENVLGEIVVGSGAYSLSNQLHCLSFTTGGTGDQKLYLKAKNFETLSSLRGSLTVEQVL